MFPREIADRRSEILNLANRFGIMDVRIFGSQMRGTALKSSDVDFVVRGRRAIISRIFWVSPLRWKRCSVGR